MPPNQAEQPGFTIRAAIIAAALSLFLLMSSTYIALKLGALPWPIIFSVIISGGLIKLLSKSKHTSIHEINTAQAGASIGGLVAAGIAFTIPGILYLNQTQNLDMPLPNPWVLGLLTATAGLLGILLSVPLKLTFVDQENLPYPAGTAGAELLKLGKTGGKQLFPIISLGAAAAIFALFRDIYFPAGFSLQTLAAIGIFLTLLPMPLAVSTGYIIGPGAGLSWFLGAVIGWFVIVPVLHHNGFAAKNAQAFAQNLGMGLVLGSGIGFFLNYILLRFKAIFLPLFKTKGGFLKLFPVLAILSIVLLSVAGVPVFAAILCVIGVWIMVAVAARMTGETNIDPLEQFGIFVGLVIATLYGLLSMNLSMNASFLIVAFVSVACAIAGDAGHDYKSSHIIGTRFFDIVKVDVIAVIVSGFAAPFVFEIMRKGFAAQLFTAAMPAPQSQLVASSIFGFQYPLVFMAGFGFAFFAEFVNRFLPARLQNRVLMMPLGIGLFLGLGLAIPLMLGALVRIYLDKKYPDFYKRGLVIAAGIMGGEGIAGFSAGAFTVSGLSFKTGALILIVIFSVIFLFSLCVHSNRNNGLLLSQ